MLPEDGTGAECRAYQRVVPLDPQPSRHIAAMLSAQEIVPELFPTCSHPDRTPRICTHASPFPKQCRVLDSEELGGKMSIVGDRAQRT